MKRVLLFGVFGGIALILIIIGIVSGIVISRNKSGTGDSATALGTIFKFDNVGTAYWSVDEYMDSNPTLRVNRGATYTFKRVSANHPLIIENKNEDSITELVRQGSDVVWTVPINADSEYYYRCTSHQEMNGRIEVDN